MDATSRWLSSAPANDREDAGHPRRWASRVRFNSLGKALVLCCALGSASLPSRASADCPTSTITLPCPWTSIATTAAARDTGCSYYSPDFQEAQAAFNLPLGTIDISLYPPFGGSSGEIHMAERYMLTGPPAGTPITFTLRLPVTATIAVVGSDVATSASGTASLELDGVVIAQASETRSCHDYFDCTTTGNLSTTLSAGAEIPSGQAFQLVTRLTGSVSGAIINPGSVRIDGTVHFDDLPPGATLLSCHDPGAVSVGRGSAIAGLHLIDIAPNPSRGPLRATFAANAGGPVIVTVLDVAGRVCSSAVVDARTPGTHSVRLAPSEPLPAGFYVVRVAQGASADARAVTIVR